MKRLFLKNVQVKNLDLPENIKWEGDQKLVDHNVQLMQNENKTLVILADCFGGFLKWAVIPKMNIDKFETEILKTDIDEIKWLKKNYPELLKTMESF